MSDKTDLVRLEKKIDLITELLLPGFGANKSTSHQLKLPEQIEVLGPDKERTNLKLEFASYEHRWSGISLINWWNTWYNYDCYVMNKDNGTIPTWNAIQTACKPTVKEDVIDWDYTGEFLRTHGPNASHGYSGYGGPRAAKDDRIWTVARFYSNAGVWKWRWFSG